MEFEGQLLTTLLEDRDATVWAGTSGGLTGFGTLCAIAGSGVRCHGKDGTGRRRTARPSAALLAEALARRRRTP
jgi:hypothetical protein